MKTMRKLLLLSFPAFLLAVLALSAPVFAQSPYTNSDGIGCGNNVCEYTSFSVRVGEEKSLTIGGKPYTFKPTRIEKQANSDDKGNTWYSYNIYLSINGGPGLNPYDAARQAGIEISAFVAGDNTEAVEIQLYEDKFCAVPDCAFRAEFSVYKKWNLMPLFFIAGGGSSSEIEKFLAKGTCKLQDFIAIYAHNPLEKKFVSIYTWGMSASTLSSSLTNFGNLFQSPRTLAGTPFNSVWLYSRTDCRLVAEIPKQLEEFLLLLTTLAAQSASVPIQATESAVIKEEVRPEQVTGAATDSLPAQELSIGFAPGWNFFAGSKDMKGKSFDEIRGSCTIEKAYSFDGSAQSWRKISVAPGPEEGFVLKVANRCLLGAPQVAPPSIPE